MPGKENNEVISSAVVGRSPCLVREFYLLLLFPRCVPFPWYTFCQCIYILLVLYVVIYLFYHPPTSPFTGKSTLSSYYVVVVVVFTLKAVPVSTQYFLTSVLVQLTRTPSVVTG